MKMYRGDNELEDNKSGLDGCELHSHSLGMGNPKLCGLPRISLAEIGIVLDD